MTSAAAKKAWATRRRQGGSTKAKKAKNPLNLNFKAIEESVGNDYVGAIKGKKGKRRGKKRKGRNWGPGNPLWEWKQKQK